MMRCVTGCVAVRAVLLGLISCEHRILTDPKDNHYIRVYLDEQIKNVTCGFYNPDYERPDYDSPVNLRAVLADPESGETVSERILRGNGQDERGRYIDGYLAAPAGTYNLLIHGVGSSVTRISNMQNYYDMYAYTDSVGEEQYRFCRWPERLLKRKITMKMQGILTAKCSSTSRLSTIWETLLPPHVHSTPWRTVKAAT